MKDYEIQERVTRIEEIIEVLEAGDVSLEMAKELRDEAHELLAEIDDHLDVGDGSVDVLNE